MFPLLPALILLLLQGPSSFERLAVDGRLPGALEAINRHMALPRADKLSEREEQVLASLIASGNSVQLTRALMSFLWSDDEKQPKGEPLPAEQSKPVVEPSKAPPPQDGYSDCRRTRDGPTFQGVA